MVVAIRRRFLLACAVPFACVFGATLLRGNAMFALDGMINHTAVDMVNINNVKKEDAAVNVTISAADSCILVRTPEKYSVYDAAVLPPG
jgi:hypothetical protein